MIDLPPGIIPEPAPLSRAVRLGRYLGLIAILVGFTLLCVGVTCASGEWWLDLLAAP